LLVEEPSFFIERVTFARSSTSNLTVSSNIAVWLTTVGNSRVAGSLVVGWHDVWSEILAAGDMVSTTLENRLISNVVANPQLTIGNPQALALKATVSLIVSGVTVPVWSDWLMGSAVTIDLPTLVANGVIKLHVTVENQEAEASALSTFLLTGWWTASTTEPMENNRGWWTRRLNPCA